MSDSDKSEVRKLIDQLKKDRSPKMRIRAAELLSHLNSSESLEALLQAQLNDPNPRVKEAASKAVASFLTTSQTEELNEVHEREEREKEAEEDKMDGENDGEEKSSTGINNRLYDPTKKIKVIRTGMYKRKYRWKEFPEIDKLFDSIEKDRFLPKQQIVRSLLNSLLMLPIDNVDLGRDVALTLIEVLDISSDEDERADIIASLNNIITNIDKYNAYFGVAESFLMIMNSSSTATIRVAGIKSLEETILKGHTLIHLSRHTNDIQKLMTFSYDQKIRIMALKAYPDIVLSSTSYITFLSDLIIGVLRATYEEQLRKLGLKALESLIVTDNLTEEFYEAIIDILKSHQPKSIRLRATEIFTSSSSNLKGEKRDFTLRNIREIIKRSKNDDICFSSLQLIEKLAGEKDSHPNLKKIFELILEIGTNTRSTLLVIRAFSMLEEVINRCPNCVTDEYLENFLHVLGVTQDIGVLERTIETYTELIIYRNMHPSNLFHCLKTISMFPHEELIIENLIKHFRNALVDYHDLDPDNLLQFIAKISNKTKDRTIIANKINDYVKSHSKLC